MKTLKFLPELVPLITSGVKSVTWRLFDDKNLQPEDLVSFINAETGKEFAKAKIISVKETTFGGLTKKDKSEHETFESDEEMYTTYSRYYHTKVGANTPLKIIRFKLLEE